MSIRQRIHGFWSIFKRGSRSGDRQAPTQSASPPQTADASRGVGYSSDQPIRSKEEDRFNRWPFAARIADTLAGRRDPSSLVIGIYGAWGEGKSSALVLMEQALKRHGHVVCVRFNPWHFESQEQLLRGFFATLATALGRSLPTKVEELGRMLEHYGSLLSFASVSVGGGMVKLGAGDAARSLGRALSTVELDDLRSRLEGFLREAGKRVVVLIDDIDRLDRREIQAVFKLVKLSANFEYTSYVLAFDDEMVAGALGEKYGAGGVEAGRSFLEKIVQVPLHLPPADQLSLRRLVFEGVEAALGTSGIALSEEQVEAFVRHFVDGIEPRITTPRQVKLYINALAFALPIMKGEVHPVDQMLIEGIRVFYPKLYVGIRDNPEYFLKGGRGAREEGFKKRAAEIIDSGLEGTGIADKEQIRHGLLEVLFPRLKGVFGNVNYGPDWDGQWEREQRICSESYFERYFRYGISPGDVSDLTITEFLEKVRAGEETEAVQAFRDLADGGRMRRLIPKLRRREESVDPEFAARLAVVVARNGSMLPREKAMILSDWTFTQGAILVAQLTKRVPARGRREELARRVITEAEPLAFAFECLRWLRKGERDSEADRLIPEEVEEELGRLLAERVGIAAAQTPLYRTFGEDVPRLYWAWNRYGRQGEVAEHLKQRFDADAAEVDEFLAVFVGKAWGLESGLSHRADFERDAYDAIAKLIDPEAIVAKLKARYGAELDDPEFYHSNAVPFARRVAHQFAYVHKKVREGDRQDKAPDEG